MSTRTSRVVWDLIARDNASRTFARVSGAANGMSRTVTGVGAAISRGFAIGTVATAGLGASVLKMAGDFEKNMNRVEALSGATGSQLEKLRDQAKDLGRSTQYGAAQTADAMAQLATAGLGVNQIYGAMPSVLSLASSEQLDLTRAAEITTNVLTGYGMSIDKIPHSVDAMVKASVKANTSVDDLGEAFKYSGPIAHQAGIQFEEAVAATALMGNAGIKASMAGTALRGAVTRLLSPTAQVSERLDKLGVSVATSDGKLRPLTDIVGQLAKKGATTGDIMTIFGQRAGPGMAALIQQGSDKLAGLTKELENSGGTAEKISKIQMKGWQGEIIRLKNAWEGLMIEVGDTGVLTGATKALSGITLGVRGFADFVNSEGIPRAKQLSQAIGGLVPGEKIKNGFRTAKTAIADFFTGLMPSKAPAVPVPMLKAPQAPSALALPAPPKSDTHKWGEEIRKALQGGIEHLDWGKLGNSLGQGLGAAIGWIGGHVADLTKKFAGVIAKIDWVDVGKGVGGQALPFAIGFIGNLFAPLFSLDFWKKHWLDTIIAVFSVIPIGRIAGALGKLVGKIPFLRIFEPMLSGIGKLGGVVEKGLGKSVLKPLGRFGKAVWDGIVRGFTRVFPATAGKLNEFLSKLAINILAYAGRFAGFGERVIRGLGNGILRGGGKIGEWIGRIIGYIVKPFAKAGGWLWGKGSDLVRGLTRGISGAARGIGTWVWTRAGRPVVDAFRSAGSWLYRKGASLLTGLKSGIVTGARGLGGWAWRTAGRPVVDAFRTAGSWLVSKGRSVVSGLKSGAVSAARGLGGWAWRTAGRPAVDAFKSAGTWLRSKGGALISGLKSGITGAIKGIGGWIKKSVVDPVVGAVKRFFGIRSPSRVFMGIGGHLVSGLMRGMAKTSGKAIASKVFGDLPSALGALVKKGLVSVSSLPGKALKALGGLGSKFLSFLGIGGGGGGKGVNRWAPIVSQVLSMLGAPATALGPVLKRIQLESGGNPNAINLWDSNAKAGHPSQGLMQTIPGTFAAYAGPFRSRGITDPLANIYAGVNYAMHRYGGNWLNVMTRPGGYAKGSRGAAPGWAWVGEEGPELINLKGGEDILSHPDSMEAARRFGIRLPGYASGTVGNAQAKVNQRKKELEDAKDDLARAKRRHIGIQAAQTELKAAKTKLKAAQQSLADAKRRTRTAVANAITNGFRKVLTTGTASAIASAIKSMIGKLQNAGVGKGFIKSVQKKSDQLQGLASKRASVKAKIKAANEYASEQAGNIRDFLSISGTSATSVGGLISQMKSQQGIASGFANLTKSLQGRGASKELLAQLAEAGPGSQLAAILGDRHVTTGQIGQLNKLVKSGNTLATGFGRTMADTMFDSGKHAGEGFLAGLKAQEKDLKKQMETLADALIKSIKKKLKIKSPSQVFRDQVGKQLALGMAQGMDQHRPHVEAAARRLADTAYGGANSRSTAANTAFTQLSQMMAAGQLGGTEIHVHFDDPSLKDLIRVTAKPMIQASEGQQAYRARVGRRQ